MNYLPNPDRKNLAVVLEEAGEMDAVADHVIKAVFRNMGKSSISNARLIVHRKHKNELVHHLLDKLRDWRMGDQFDPQDAF